MPSTKNVSSDARGFSEGDKNILITEYLQFHIFYERIFNYYYLLINKMLIPVANALPNYTQSFKLDLLRWIFFFERERDGEERKLLTSIFIDLLRSNIFHSKGSRVRYPLRSTTK